jgi:hypothetical protein
MGIVREAGRLAGEFRSPRNLHTQSRGSIHNDAVATKLGFRGGTVAGIIHHEQFAPLMLEAFGQRWFETGGISLYYTQASTDTEPVQAFAELPPAGATDAQVNVWMQHQTGFKVLEGTASIGRPAQPSHLRQRYAARRDPGKPTILAGVEPGLQMEAATVRMTTAEQESRRTVITEPLDWYWGASPWGGPICTPVTMFRLLNAGLRRRWAGAAVGLYGAIEINVRRGPLFVEHDYVVQGRILAIGETPKSEYLWWESQLRDAATGAEVADMLMMNRVMKGSAGLLQVT